jgi:BON domain-containing protein
MKLRKRFWGILGGLAIAAGTVHAADSQASNQQAANDIASAIARELPDRGYTVNVEYRGGIATLRGTVSGPAQLHRILAATRSCPDVRRVVNQIEVAGDIRTVGHDEGTVAAGATAPVQVTQGQPLGAASPEFRFAMGAPPQYDAPYLPPFAWPAYAPYPNYTAVQYPKQYGSNQWPYIGPFHPYPEVPLDWREVKLYTAAGLKPIAGAQDPPPEWHCIKLRWEDGHWYLSFKQAWWAKRCWLNSLCGPCPVDDQIGCSTGPGFRVKFHQPVCTHMFTN